MSSMTIDLSDEMSSRLRETAARIGVSPETLARAGLEDWLGRPREDFIAAARYVLEKNEELYRRLA
jgi:predicted transcriptional regulator